MGMKEELVSLGDEIENAKKSVFQLEGRLEEIHERLQKEFGVMNSTEAEVKLKKLKKEITHLGSVIEGDFKNLKEGFSW